MPTPSDQGTTLVGGSMFLSQGANSWSQATALDDTQYVMGMNVVCRGGKVRTRPGTRIIASLYGDNAQGSSFFVPAVGTPAHVVALDGKIFVASAPFRNYVQLPNIQFNPLAKYVAFAVCQQSTDYNATGQLYFLDTPKTVLIMQDGYTRAAYWDGVNSGHIDPTQTGAADITVPGKDGTKIGLWMAWSNNRLWVSRDNMIFASDIGNPLKFTEAQYLNEGRAFYLAGPCTGIIETPDRRGILCFTDKDATLLQSSIQDRTQWLDTPNFQQIVLPNTGCVAPLSLINQYGLTWWFSSTGLQNLDSALNENITSKIFYQDFAMAASKQNIGSDMAGICAGFYENYLLVSVPSGDIYNRHTWVLDQMPYETNPNAWPSYWTGWRPVQWNRAVIDGQEKLFFLSVDYDGVTRVWQAFHSEHNDNGAPITCFLQTKQHNFGDVYRKKWRYARMFLSDVSGPVSLRTMAMPMNGTMFSVLSKDIVATTGQVYDDQAYGGTNAGFNNVFAANRPQTRIVYTQADQGDTTTQTNCGVEKPDTDNEDYAFGLLMLWSGDMAVAGYQIFCLRDREKQSGDCETNEVGPLSTNYDGVGSTTLFPAGSPFGSLYTSTVIYCTLNNTCVSVTKQSVITQAAADQQALDAARFAAEFEDSIYI